MSIRNDEPQFEVVQPSIHEVCGHAHHSFEACPPTGGACGSFICCRPEDFDDSECSGCGAEVDCVCPE